MQHYSLTTPQRNIWNLQRFYENTSISNICGAVIFNNRFEYAIVRRALNKLIEMQEGLRLRFCYDDQGVVQYTAEYHEEDFEFIRFGSEEELDVYADTLSKTPMQLTDAKMYRLTVFELDGHTGIIMCANHLITDAWSFSLLANETEKMCIEFSADRPIEIQKHSYTVFFESEKKYFSSKRFKNDEEYWKEEFSRKIEAVSLKNEVRPAESPEAKRFTARLTPETTEKIDLFCRKLGVSQAVLFESALLVYMFRLNADESSVRDLVIGNLILNRQTPEQKNTAGMFISTIPLKVTINAENTVSELLGSITTSHFKTLRHQKYPYSLIAENYRKSHGDDTIYHAVISFQNAQTNTDARTKWYSNGYSEVPFYMHIDNRDSLDTYTITIDYQTEIFGADEISLIYKRLVFVIGEILSSPEKKVRDIGIIPPEEYHKLVYDLNDTERYYPTDKCIHELFSEIAKKLPDKEAVVFEGRSISYRQLDEMSNSLAHYLRSVNGIGRGEIVPIISSRTWLFYVAMLGILKAGGAFLSVSADFPEDRIRYMLNECRPGVILTNTGFSDTNTDVIDLDSFDYSYNTADIVNVNEPDDLCYVIYTSGSTGNPKGLMIRHRNAVNYSCKNELNVMGKIIPDNSLRFLSITNTIFDMFITECILTMVNGITVIFANQNETVSQRALSELCRKTSPDIIETTPSKLKMLMSDESDIEFIRNMKIFILGGEEMTPSFYKLLRSRTDGIIFNNYGPAETTVWSTMKKVEESITIGKPIANTQVYILDRSRQLVPTGIAGEICISGAGVGIGYLNNPGLTSEKYLPDPFVPENNMYCTGDLARWRTDGEIDYLGRIDTQVKIRGLRIELGEIESTIAGFEGIELCAVTDKRDENNRQFLAGYYTSGTKIDEKALRAHLAASLPKYMIPNYFVRLEKMPMTASGKIDRKELPLPSFSTERKEYTAPKTEKEKLLCSLVGELLKIEKVGVTDDFFELGGDSLTAIEYIARAHNLGIEIALQNIFDHPTVAELCEFIEKGNRVTVEYDPGDFKKYEALLMRNSTCCEPVLRPLGNVLLTGATGFLGAHVLDALMQNEIGKIYCLIRDHNKFTETLHYYFADKYDCELNKRIVIVEGDIEVEGLSDSAPDDVQTVIHTAASVKHYGAYEYFYKVNTLGTRNVIDYAKEHGAKLIHVSTLSVSGNSLVDVFDLNMMDEDKDFDETCLYIGQPLDNVYVRSKFEAERAVFDAMLEGLDAKIIRVGNLTNRTTDLRFQPNYKDNAFVKRVKAFLEFGMIPDYLLDIYTEFSPIDKTAEGIVRIAEYSDKECIFHLNSNKPLYFRDLINMLGTLGINIRLVSADTFKNALYDYARSEKTEYIYEAFQNDMDENGRLVYDLNIHIKNEFTVDFLKKLGFEWNETDIAYISRYIDYFRKIGYLEV